MTQIDRFFLKYDTDKDGKLSVNEYLNKKFDLQRLVLKLALIYILLELLMEHFQYTNDEELNLSKKIYFEVK